MSTQASIQNTTARADSLHSVVQGRANPKRLAELAEMLVELRDWAWLEAKVETEKPKQEIWLQVRDWATVTAAQKKLNLDAVPLALKTQIANGGTESETTRPGGSETAHRERRDESPNGAGEQPPPTTKKETNEK